MMMRVNETEIKVNFAFFRIEHASNRKKVDLLKSFFPYIQGLKPTDQHYQSQNSNDFITLKVAPYLLSQGWWQCQLGKTQDPKNSTIYNPNDGSRSTYKYEEGQVLLNETHILIRESPKGYLLVYQRPSKISPSISQLEKFIEHKVSRQAAPPFEGFSVTETTKSIAFNSYTEHIIGRNPEELIKTLKKISELSFEGVTAGIVDSKSDIYGIAKFAKQINISLKLETKKTDRAVKKFLKQSLTHKVKDYAKSKIKATRGNGPPETIDLADFNFSSIQKIPIGDTSSPIDVSIIFEALIKAYNENESFIIGLEKNNE
jgi:hypothetical protein